MTVGTRLLCQLLATGILCQAICAAPRVAEGVLADAEIDVMDARLEALIDPTAQVETLADGFEMTEGPVWLESESALLFTDPYPNRVYRWSEQEGLMLFLQPAGYTGDRADRATLGMLGANGLALDADNRLLLCQQGDRRIARLSTDGRSYETVADRYQGKRLNSTNDLIVASDGSIYFTDPPTGFRREHWPDELELSFNGVYRVSPSGEVTLVTRDMGRPNGVALSPDEATLYVSNSQFVHAAWWQYPLLPGGVIGEGALLFDATELVKERRFGADGMAVDHLGNLWATGPGGVLIITPAGELLGMIRLPLNATNCAFGGTEGRTLYITGYGYLLRIQTKVTSAVRQ